MQTDLDLSRTWFFDSLEQNLSGDLRIDLVEGIKGNEAVISEISPGVTIGPYFPIQVLPESKCVRVTFPNTIAFLSLNESFDKGDKLLECDEGVLRECTNSHFIEFINQSTNIPPLAQAPYSTYLLWTEDRLFYVTSSERPIVQICDEPPDLSLSRTITWSAT